MTVDYTQTHSQRLRANRLPSELANIITSPKQLLGGASINAAVTQGGGSGGGGGTVGGVTGTGTVGHHTRWATTTSLQDSVMFEDTGAISIQAAKPLDFTRQNLPAVPATGFLRIFANINPALFYSLDPSNNLHGPFLGPGLIWVGGTTLGSGGGTSMTASWTPSNFTVAGYTQSYMIAISVNGLTLAPGNPGDALRVVFNNDNAQGDYQYRTWFNFQAAIIGNGIQPGFVLDVNVNNTSPRWTIMYVNDNIGIQTGGTPVQWFGTAGTWFGSNTPTSFMMGVGEWLKAIVGSPNFNSITVKPVFFSSTTINAGSRIDVYAMRGQSG